MDHLEMRLRIAFHFSADLANGFYGLPSMAFNHPGWQPSISQWVKLIRGTEKFLYIVSSTTARRPAVKYDICFFAFHCAGRTVFNCGMKIPSGTINYIQGMCYSFAGISSQDDLCSKKCKKSISDRRVCLLDSKWDGKVIHILLTIVFWE